MEMSTSRAENSMKCMIKQVKWGSLCSQVILEILFGMNCMKTGQLTDLSVFWIPPRARVKDTYLVST